MNKHFDPIRDKAADIIETIMNAPEMTKDEALQFKIRLSVEEAVVNVCNYAYQGGIGWMEVATNLSPDGLSLSIEMRDAGIPFNPLDKDDPDVTLDADEREIGGLGIFLCKQLMDDISYRYEDGCNILTMTKVLS